MTYDGNYPKGGISRFSLREKRVNTELLEERPKLPNGRPKGVYVYEV